MSVVTVVTAPDRMKTQTVTATIETEAIVHRCDRCGKEEPCEIDVKVKTDHNWANGAIRVLSLPRRWLTWPISSMGSDSNSSRWHRLLDFCETCAPKVADGFAAFCAATGIKMPDNPLPPDRRPK